MPPSEVPPQPLELTPAHLERLRRLLAEGFQPAQFPYFTGCVGLKKDDCVALLRPGAEGAFEFAAPPTLLVAGNLSAKVEQGGEVWFVWKTHRVRGDEERLGALRRFQEELERGLTA
jgi:hypothetical protein